MKIVHQWLAELVDVPSDVEVVAREIALRGFEVAAVENGVIDFEITANRPDCLCHLGIAREAAVIWRTALKPPPLRHGHSGVAIPVRIEAPDLCARYSAQLFDVKVGSSPSWLTKRLEAAGVRPINNIVDVTNYVMLEIGQPMHAFDVEKLAGGELVIRRAAAGETLRTLDGVDRTLDRDMLTIADAQRPVAIGGVMGGANSEISGSTRRMVLESAHFDPRSVRQTSKRLGLKTEASTRFERGGDIEATVVGLARAAALLEQIGAAQGLEIRDVYPSPQSARTLVLRNSRIQHVLGTAVAADEVPPILTRLGFSVASHDGSWTITVPSYRVDVTREVDLIEEVGRHYGFDRIPTTFPPLAKPQAAPDPRIERDRRIKAVLAAAGFSESMTFAFIERDAAAPFAARGADPIAIANPLSEKFAVLRPSLLPGLIDSCAHNRRRGRKDVRLFECGTRFTQAGERRGVGFVWSGEGSPSHWSSETRAADFFDVKGVAELLCGAFGLTPLEFEPSAETFLVPGRSATVMAASRMVGCVGQIDPAIVKARGLSSIDEIYGGEIDVDALGEASARDDLRTEPLPKYPAIVRDLSILVAEVLPAAAVRGTIRSAAPATLETLDEFDRYQGRGVPEGRVSLSLRLTFRSSERTLTDEEVEAAMNTIVGALSAAHGAERR